MASGTYNPAMLFDGDPDLYAKLGTRYQVTGILAVPRVSCCHGKRTKGSRVIVHSKTEPPVSSFSDQVKGLVRHGRIALLQDPPCEQSSNHGGELASLIFFQVRVSNNTIGSVSERSSLCSRLRCCTKSRTMTVNTIDAFEANPYTSVAGMRTAPFYQTTWTADVS